MKCEVCDQEFVNSEELKRHMEESHPMGEEEGEKPDLMDDPGLQGRMRPEQNEMPDAERSSR